jgi:S-adenosylmethionine hydrolase
VFKPSPKAKYTQNFSLPICGWVKIGYTAFGVHLAARTTPAFSPAASFGHLGETLTTRQALVLMTDFGVRDGAVAAMKGVACAVDSSLSILDLTHEVKPFDVWEGAYRLYQTHGYWQDGTVFVVVVDPGVGTLRKSLAARLRSGQIVVCPDNGLLTWLEPQLESVRELDETRHRLPGSSESHTFLGRDLYAHVGAKLASGQLEFEEVGAQVSDIVQLEVSAPRLEDGVVWGAIPVLDINFGNVWTNVPKALLQQVGNPDWLEVRMFERGVERFCGRLPFVRSFGAVADGEGLVYVNSLLHAAVALNRGSFAQKFAIGSGLGWSVSFRLDSQN